MSQAANIIEALKSVLRSQKCTYNDLASTLSMTEAGVKKAFASQSFSLSKIEQICMTLDISLMELVQLAEVQTTRKKLSLTVEQETELAVDEDLFTVYYLVLVGANYEGLSRSYSFSAADLERLFLRLDRLQLVEYGPKNSVRVRVKNPVWIDNGPLIEKYGEEILREFALGPAAADEGYKRFLFGHISEDKLKSLHSKMKQLEIEFLLSCELQPSEKSTSAAFFHIVRPWRFSLFDRYRIKKD